MKRLRGAIVLTILLSAFASQATAQSLYGSLVGNVTDETGLAVPGATVTVTQTRDKPVARRGDQRDRRVQRAEPAARHLPGRCQAAGISTYTARDIAVRQGLDLRVDARLKRWRARGVDRRVRARRPFCRPRAPRCSR